MLPKTPSEYIRCAIPGRKICPISAQNLANFMLGGQNILWRIWAKSTPSGDGTRPEFGGEKNNSKHFEVIH
ncbi:hypothetical protein TSAR_001245 [Trichomalopsis sarcophagae]|uniref:Uncharacterized protein n=1 Tax=Trichomalopsis sarcophagae TaxID=543379 RepID=A0A232ESD8_9HYME|nr:hypothetical protein TSAR_001245 [Trichomalopsis sarcophagae]